MCDCERRGHTDAYTDSHGNGDSYSNADSYGYSDSNSHCNGHTYSNRNSNSTAYAYGTATANTCTSPVISASSSSEKICLGHRAAMSQSREPGIWFLRVLYVAKAPTSVTQRTYG